MKVYFCDVCGADLSAYTENEIGTIEMSNGSEYLDRYADVFDVCPECFKKVMNYIKGGAK